MATLRQRRGAIAEEEAVRFLERLGWRIAGRNLRIGRDEVDIVALDPGPPPEVVLVEVRSAASSLFGRPEERVDRRKVGHLYRALSTLVAADELPVMLRALPRRIDLVIVDRRSGTTLFRHLRSLEPP